MDNITIIIILGIIAIIFIILNHVTFVITTMKNKQGNCSQTAFGCCPDGVNSKINYYGSNCPQYNAGPGYPTPGPGPVPPKPIGGCAGTKYGCCPNNETPKINTQGSNCLLK